MYYFRVICSAKLVATVLVFVHCSFYNHFRSKSHKYSVRTARDMWFLGLLTANLETFIMELNLNRIWVALCLAEFVYVSSTVESTWI